MEKRGKLILFTACIALFTLAAMNASAVTEGVDPSQTWIGFMNVSNLPADGGAYQFGSSWGTSALQANFSGPVLTLAPCTNVWETTDTYWVKPDGVSPNKNMDAVMYVQNDALAGSSVTFTGLGLANTLVSPYTCVAFVKEFASDYSSYTSSTTPLVPSTFSVTLNTTPGGHVQYGFETIGPDANPTTAASLGNAQVTAVPEPTSIVLVLGGLLGLVAVAKKHRA